MAARRRSPRTIVAVALGLALGVAGCSETEPTHGPDKRRCRRHHRGRLILPGFQDTHVHVPEAGINENLCMVDPGLTVADYEALIAGCAEDQQDETWVRVAGASLFDLRPGSSSSDAGAELPIDVLDRLVPDKPALVLDDLGHAIWTNSLGLAAAGIEQDDVDPQGGMLHRDPTSGRLSGLLLEDAQQMVRNAATLDEEVVYDGLLLALEELAANGITTMSDAGGYWLQGYDRSFERALAVDELTVRAVNSLYLYSSLDSTDQLAEFRARFRDDPESLLRVNTAKVYVDGILDLGTASLLEPYDIPPDPRFPSGFTYLADEDLDTYASALHELGFKLEFHVIGDAATRRALDAIEQIDDTPDGIAARRHRLTHTYLVDPADVPRFASLGVVADFEVGPESSSAEYHEYHEYLSTSIGDRAFDLIPIDRLLEAGAPVSLSSDWDADPLSPLGIIARSMNRDNHAVADVAEAIRLLTIGAAYALGQDDLTGSLEVGKYADFVMLDRNIVETAVADIEQAEVVLTVVGGQKVFEQER